MKRRLLLLAVAALAHESMAAELDVSIWPVDSVFTMPMAARVLSVPKVGAVATATPAYLDPERFLLRYTSKVVAGDWKPSDLFVTYDARPMATRMAPVFGELYDREVRAKQLSAFGESPSSRPTTDPLNLLAPSDDERALVDATRSLALSSFWQPEMLKVRSTAQADESGRYTVVTLEEKIRPLLDKQSVALAAVVLGTEPDGLATLISSILAQQVRASEMFLTTEIENPFAQYQRVQINDPAIQTSGNNFLGTFEQFVDFGRRYCQSAYGYWQRVGFDLLDNMDRELFSHWGILADDRIVAKITPSRGTPLDIVDAGCRDFDDGVLKHEKHVKMVERISYYAAYFFFKGYPAGVGEDPFEGDRASQIGKWLAELAAAELGYDEKMVEGHLFTYQGYVSPIMLTLLGNRFSIAAIMHPTEDIESWEGVAFAEKAGLIFSPIITKKISKLYWGSPMGKFLGGAMVVNPAKPVPPTTRYQYLALDDYDEGPDTLRDLLLDPTGNRQATFQRLEDWRALWHDGVSKYVRNRISSAEEEFSDYWRSFEGLAVDFTAAEENAQKYQTLANLVRSYNKSIGYRSLELQSEGRVLMAPDTIVTGVQVVANEFAAEGAPVVTTRDRFTRHGQATVKKSDMPALNLNVGMTSYTPVEDHPELRLSTRVMGIAVNDAGDFDVTVRISLVVVARTIAPNMAGMPETVPVTSLMCDVRYALLAADSCDYLERDFLPYYGSVEIEIAQ